MKRSLLFLCAGLLTFSGNLFANLSQTFTHTTVLGAVPFTDNFTLTSFNSGLGTLQSITLSWVTSGNANVSLVNLTGTPQAFSNATASFPLTLTGPAGLTVSGTVNAGPFAGTIGSGVGPFNFSGPTNTSSASISIAPAGFAAYQSAGPIGLSFSAGAAPGTFGGSSAAGVFFGGSGDVSEITSITYDYAVTPEPALMGVLSLGLCGLFLIRRKSLKKS